MNKVLRLIRDNPLISEDELSKMLNPNAKSLLDSKYIKDEEFDSAFDRQHVKIYFVLKS